MQFRSLPIDKEFGKWFYECMSAKKIDLVPKIKVVGQDEVQQNLKRGENMDAVLLSQSPVVKPSFKELIEKVFQFVSVGGDFV